jgi:uncharacterized cupredoxin-like copper-binding protein
MSMFRRNLLTTTTALAASLCMVPAFAATTTVQVKLWDKGAMSMNMLGQGDMMDMEHAKGHANMPTAPMGVRINKATVPAGDVTFNVTNTSKQMVHEMVISPVKDRQVSQPYNKAENKIDEDAAGHLGEVAELDPGKKGALTLNMKPGNYLLYCNIAGHYALGMWTLLAVK